jgi:acetoin utilization deacetylase AcuC-like enzyme
MFNQRFDLINSYRENFSGDSQFTFRQRPPDITDIHRYFGLISKNQFSKEYFGQLFVDTDPWKPIGGFSDLDNLYNGIIDSIDNNRHKAYFMTNTAGHHGDNTHYELFCPINQLFFAVEVLNSFCNFPKIAWVDIDAHFGNGDKKMWDSYRTKMQSEQNNLEGISFHNDSHNVTEEGYRGFSYAPDITNEELLLFFRENIRFQSPVKYLLLFFGTDILNSDYGDNKNITPEILPKIVQLFEQIANQMNASLFIVQCGGNQGKNITELITTLRFNRGG